MKKNVMSEIKNSILLYNNINIILKTINKALTF